MIKRDKIRKYILLFVIIAIIVIAFFFPYSIHIQDALTLQPDPEFGIELSIWRIIFEPILGLLLFFNRSLYALDELLILLYWILGFYITYVILKYLLSKNIANKKKYIVNQLINLPLVVGIWFFFYVLIIFIPLPNNTIINNSETSVLVATHSHSEFSHDGLISQKGLWEWHKKNNFDAFFITDHGNHAKTFELAEKQRIKEFPQDPLIMTGEEYSGSNHMSLLGIKNYFVTKGLSDVAVIDTTHFYNGVVLINHWFSDKHNSLEYYKNLNVDGYEIENVGKELYYDRSLYEKIKAFCISNNLIMVGGLDFHGYGRSCSTWNAFEIPNWKNLNDLEKEEEIIKILRNREQEKVKVLMYKDRPYYSEENLAFSPIILVFNYLRTLSIYQVLSWIVWLVIFSLVRERVKGRMDKIIVLAGIAGSVFLILLGTKYNSNIAAVKGYSELYEEYSTLLFYIGSGFIIYAMTLLYFRFFRKNV